MERRRVRKVACEFKICKEKIYKKRNCERKYIIFELCYDGSNTIKNIERVVYEKKIIHKIILERKLT